MPDVLPERAHIPGHDTEPVAGTHVDENDDLWPTEDPAKGWRFRSYTALLLAALVAGAGFLGGVLVQKHHDRSNTTAAAASLFATGRRGAGGSTGAQGSRGAAGGAGGGGRFGAGAAGNAGGGFGGAGSTIGTVTTVDRSTLYVTDLTGNLIKVTTSGGSAITVSSRAKVSDIHPGDSVAVQGSPGPGGSTAAQRITVSPSTAGSAR